MIGSSAPPWRLCVADLAGVPRAALLGDAALLSTAIDRALGQSPLSWAHHDFEPWGVSVTGVGSRVRVAVHTWPELGMATVDVWSADDATALVASIVDVLSAGSTAARRSVASANVSHDAAG